MIKTVSLDELLEREFEREALSGDGMTIDTCDQAYINMLLEGIPEEDTSEGFYNGRPTDLVTVFRRAG